MSSLSYLSPSSSLVPGIDKCVINVKLKPKKKQKPTTTEDLESAINAEVVSKRGVPKVF